MTVAIVERHRIGGGCTHWGTIPSKALRHSIYSIMEAINNPVVALFPSQRTALKRGAQGYVFVENLFLTNDFRDGLNVLRVTTKPRKILTELEQNTRRRVQPAAPCVICIFIAKGRRNLRLCCNVTANGQAMHRRIPCEHERADAGVARRTV